MVIMVMSTLLMYILAYIITQYTYNHMHTQIKTQKHTIPTLNLIRFKSI